MTRETLEFLATLVDQVTLSAQVDADQFEEMARVIATAKRELIQAIEEA